MDINIHNIKKIEVTKKWILSKNNTLLVVIEITNDKDERTELSLFSKDMRSLKIIDEIKDYERI